MSDPLEKLVGKVKVIRRLHEDTFDGLAGRTVGAVRVALVDVFNVPAGVVTLVNDKPVDEGYVLQSGDVLEWVRV